jgi:O-antigen ligase
VVAGFAYLVVGIAAVHTGLAPIGEDTPTRAERWYPAVAAILDNPSLLGEGFVNTTAYIAPYIETAKPFFVENYTASEAPGSPHNAYLRTTIRAGLLGGLAYLTLVVSSLASGAQEVRRRHGDATVAVILLALGVGFAAHQQFEAYSLYNYGSSTVLAVFVTGFLLFGDRD